MVAILLPLLLLCCQAAAAEDLAVAVVASDNPQLAQPVPRTEVLTADQVLAMVRRAVDLVGGMASVVPDTARLVAIKPNIVKDDVSGSGVVTDARVVRAVALLVHEVAPGARLRIAEGAGGWISPAARDCTLVPEWARPADGFETAGHRAVVRELRAAGIDIECVDLNLDASRLLTVPGGGLARDQYDVAATIVDADAWINCPIAKTHGAKITCCMKNPIGTLPGRLYGWAKDSGTANHAGIPHSPAVIDEFLVDLWLTTEVDLNVVDMIAGTEGGAFEGKPHRANLVLAGRNPVATDLVAARLMGFNPDDLEFADLAWQRGRGPGRLTHVEVRGEPLDPLVTRYRKAGADYGSNSEWGEQASYGTGPRRWTLLGPRPTADTLTSQQLAALTPEPGRDGWSPLVWFGHDRIDLDTYFDDPTRCTVYAATRFTMPQADSVRYWLGSDEGLRAWVDGKPIYQFEGRRRHRLGMERVPGYLTAGEHQVLVQAGQTSGGFDFSFNVCEAIDDPLFAGNTYPGVRYLGGVDWAGAVADGGRVRGEDVQDGGFQPFAESNLTGVDPLDASRTAPDSLSIRDAHRAVTGDLIAAAAAAARLTTGGLDRQTTACLSTTPFAVSYARYQPPGLGYGPAPGRLLGWLGLRYDIRSGARHREALKTIHGWLAAGRIPLIGIGGVSASTAGNSGASEGTGPGAWYQVTGYRKQAQGVDLFLVDTDGGRWVPMHRDWWAAFPDGEPRNCPVVAVEPAGRVVTAQALADSIASLALEMGLTPWLEEPPEPWGTRRLPAGLAAWDAWVIDWERLPLDRAWLETDRAAQRYLLELGQEGSLTEIAQRRRVAAAYLVLAASTAPDPARAQAFGAAAAGYGQVADALQELARRLPAKVRPPWNEAETQALDSLPQARPLVRQARAAERQALSSLAALLGRGELPPAAEDPLRLKSKGYRLFTWKAAAFRGVMDLTCDDRGLREAVLSGKDAEGVRREISQAVAHEPGWLVVVEPVRGVGSYTVVQQPDAANGWSLVVRLDSTHGRNTPTELVVWAVPAAP